jgi:hypothetical protein
VNAIHDVFSLLPQYVMLVSATRGNRGQSFEPLVLIKFETFHFYIVFIHKIMHTILELDTALVMDPLFYWKMLIILTKP